MMKFRNYSKDYAGKAQGIKTSALEIGSVQYLSGANVTSSTIDAEYSDAGVGSIYTTSTGRLFKKVADVSASTDWEEILSDLRVAEVSLTSTQIKALNTAPRVIVSAPGAGKAIMVESVISSLSYLTAAYATNTDMYVNYDGASAGDGAGANTLATAIDSILKATASTIAVSRPQVDEVNLTQNKGISLYVGTGNPATGGGSLKVKVFYRIASI